MTTQNRVLTFFKTYLVFLVSALAVNVAMELLLSSPGIGIIVLYMILSLVGTVIFLLGRFRPVVMGILSLIAGTICELTFMSPDFLRDVYAFQISARLLFTLAITTFYWFVAWSMPAYILRRHLAREGNSDTG